jgi:hypothetical protein|tara:strand:- start:4189 stop:9384 length:5196 start_codon:yes stop_codon:yes gene_type:complete
MPKQIYKINQFHGGLNTNTDKKDLADNELTVATDIMVDKVGVVRNMGDGFRYSETLYDRNVTISPGYGIFSFQHDRKLPSVLLTTNATHNIPVGAYVGNSAGFNDGGSVAGVVYDVPSNTTLVVSLHINDTGTLLGWSATDDIFIGDRVDSPSANESGFAVYSAPLPHEAPSDGENYILLANSFGGDNITYNLYDDSGNWWRENIIELSPSGTPILPPKSVFHVIDGAVRVCDGEFKNNSSVSKWYGYISRKLFEGGNPIEIQNWYSEDSSIDAPTSGTISDVAPGIIPDGSVYWHIGSDYEESSIIYDMHEGWTEVLSGDTGDLEMSTTNTEGGASGEGTKVQNFLLKPDASDSGDLTNFEFTSTNVSFNSTSSEELYSGKSLYVAAKVDKTQREMWSPSGRSIFSTGSDTIVLRVESPSKISLLDLADNEIIWNIDTSIITDKDNPAESWFIMEFPFDDYVEKNGTVDSIVPNRIRFSGTVSQYSTADNYIESDPSIFLSLSDVRLGDSGLIGTTLLGKKDFYMTYAYDKDSDTDNESTMYKMEQLEFPKSTSQWRPSITAYVSDLPENRKRIVGSNLYIRTPPALGSTDEPERHRIVELHYINGIRFTKESFIDEGETRWITYNGIRSSTKISSSQINFIHTYFSLNGYDYDESIHIPRYKCVTIANRIAYYGNVLIDGDAKGDMMIKSPVNKFDILVETRGVEASIRDGDEIIALHSYADRILQFKRNKMHIINVSQELEFLEDTFLHKGVNHSASAVKTDYGVAWVNKYGVYLYDGTKVINLMESKGLKKISSNSWSTFLSGGTPQIGYIPHERQLIIVRNIGLVAQDNDIMIYDMVTQSWTKGKNKLYAVANFYSVSLSVSTTTEDGSNTPFNGGYVDGGGSWISSTWGAATAYEYPGGVFNGWYYSGTDDTVLESEVEGVTYTYESLEYRFVPTTDVGLEARFLFTPNAYSLVPDIDLISSDPPMTYHYNGEWQGVNDAYAGMLYPISGYANTDSNVNGEDGRAHFKLPRHKWNYSPNSYYDAVTNRTYCILMLQPQTIANEGCNMENTIGYYDHGTHQWSAHYGVGWVIKGAEDQHGMGSFIITESRHILCIIPNIRGTSDRDEHNSYTYIIRSVDTISAVEGDETHLDQWKCIGRCGVPSEQQAGGWGSDQWHGDYPHMLRTSAVGQTPASVLLFQAAFGTQGYGQSAYRKMFMGYRAVDSAETITEGEEEIMKVDRWSDYSQWVADGTFPDTPWGAGSGLYGNSEQTYPQGDAPPANYICGYKIIDMWHGHETPDGEERTAKAYATILHGGNGVIGLLLDAGMDGSETTPHTDLFYLWTRDGIVWKNINETWGKNVIDGTWAGSVLEEDYQGTFDTYAKWVSYPELIDPRNKMVLMAGIRSNSDGSTYGTYYNDYFPSLYPDNYEYTSPNNLGKVAWEGDENSSPPLMGQYQPTTEGSEPYDIITGYCTYASFDPQSLGLTNNVHLYILLFEKWGRVFGWNPSTGPQFSDMVVVSFDNTVSDGLGGTGRWKLLTDGRKDGDTPAGGDGANIWGRNGTDYSNGGTYNSSTYGPYYNMTSFAYGPGMHEIWVMEFSDGNGTEIMPDIEDDINAGNNSAYTGTGVASIMKRYITTDNFATTNFVETVISANALGYDDIGGNSFDNTKGIASPIFPFNINELMSASDEGMTQEILFTNYFIFFSNPDVWGDDDWATNPALPYSIIYKKVANSSSRMLTPKQRRID